MFALLACFGLALVVLGTTDVAIAAESSGVAALRTDDGPAPELVREDVGESEDDDDDSDVHDPTCGSRADSHAADQSSVAPGGNRRRSIAIGLGRGPPLSR